MVFPTLIPRVPWDGGLMGDSLQIEGEGPWSVRRDWCSTRATSRGLCDVLGRFGVLLRGVCARYGG
jgi:hypothetical protein